MSRRQNNFFIKMHQINGTRLNPKCDIIAKEVFEVYIEEVFGKVAKFKTINIWLHANTKKDLFHLRSQILWHVECYKQ